MDQTVHHTKIEFTGYKVVSPPSALINLVALYRITLIYNLQHTSHATSAIALGSCKLTVTQLFTAHSTLIIGIPKNNGKHERTFPFRLPSTDPDGTQHTITKAVHYTAV